MSYVSVFKSNRICSYPGCKFSCRKGDTGFGQKYPTSSAHCPTHPDWDMLYVPGYLKIPKKNSKKMNKFIEKIRKINRGIWR